MIVILKQQCKIWLGDISMSVKLIKIIIGALVLSLASFGIAFADMEGDAYYPVAGHENVTDEELIDHHDNVLHNMYDDYDKKLDASEKFYKGELTRREKLQEQRMERREVSAELRKERAIQRSEAHAEYLERKAELAEKQFEKKNYFVEAMKEKREYFRKKEAAESGVEWQEYTEEDSYNSKESNEMNMQQ